MSSVTDNLAVLGAPTEQQFYDGLRVGQPVLEGSTFRIPSGGTYSTQFEGWRFRTDEWLCQLGGPGLPVSIIAAMIIVLLFLFSGTLLLAK